MIASKLKTLFYLLVSLFLLTSSLFIFLRAEESKIIPPETLAEINRSFNRAKISPPEQKTLSYYPENPSPGDFLVVKAGPFKNETEVAVSFDFPGSFSPQYRADHFVFFIIAIDYESEPGSYNLQVESKLPGQDKERLQDLVSIRDKEFPIQRFTMPPDRTAGWTTEQLAEDREKMQRARDETKLYPLWNEEFTMPLAEDEGLVSSEFAAIRYINNNPPRRHQGIDIAATQGTPLVAINRGIVRLAEFLLSGGNTVIIDHGMNLSSGYMHLDTIAVEAGEFVEKGQFIGTLGMTGYATGPHLHWELRIGQVPVNPDQAMEEDLLWIFPANVK